MELNIEYDLNTRVKDENHRDKDVMDVQIYKDGQN